MKSLQDKGVYVAYCEEAGRKRGETQKMRIQARKEWEKANSGRLDEEKDHFIREIQPLLQTISVREIAKTCNCLLRDASLIRNGENVPHPVFYHELEKLISNIR